MKRTLTIIAAVVLLFAVSACAQKKGKENKEMKTLVA